MYFATHFPYFATHIQSLKWGSPWPPFRPSDHSSTHLKHRGYTQRSPNYPPDKSNLLFRQQEPGGGRGKTALGDFFVEMGGEIGKVGGEIYFSFVFFAFYGRSM
jgi:hypothetical protein